MKMIFNNRLSSIQVFGKIYMLKILNDQNHVEAILKKKKKKNHVEALFFGFLMLSLIYTYIMIKSFIYFAFQIDKNFMYSSPPHNLYHF